MDVLYSLVQLRVPLVGGVREARPPYPSLDREGVQVCGNELERGWEEYEMS